MIHDIIVISAHILDHTSVDGRATTVFSETLEFAQHCHGKSGISGGGLQIIVGFDANTTLPASWMDLTGAAVIPPLKTHSLSMSRVVLSWLASLGVRCLNTFGTDCRRETLWTCGRKREPPNRSQIDYLAASFCVKGSAEATDIEANVFKDAVDHRPLVGGIPLSTEIPGTKGARTITFRVASCLS